MGEGASASPGEAAWSLFARLVVGVRVGGRAGSRSLAPGSGVTGGGTDVADVVVGAVAGAGGVAGVGGDPGAEGGVV